MVGALGLELDRLVVLVAEHVERADHDARRAAGAEARHDDLVIEVAPLGLVGEDGMQPEYRHRSVRQAVRIVRA